MQIYASVRANQHLIYFVREQTTELQASYCKIFVWMQMGHVGGTELNLRTELCDSLTLGHWNMAASMGFCDPRWIWAGHPKWILLLDRMEYYLLTSDPRTESWELCRFCGANNCFSLVVMGRDVGKN